MRLRPDEIFIWINRDAKQSCVLLTSLELKTSPAVYWGTFTLIWEKWASTTWCWPRWHVFFFLFFWVCCIPNVLQHVWLPLVNTTVFSLTAHFTPPIQLYLNRSFQQLMAKESVYFSFFFFFSACPLHTSSRTSRKFMNSWTRSFFFLMTNGCTVCVLSWSFPRQVFT